MPPPDPDPRQDLRRRMRTLLATIDPDDLADRSRRAADNLFRAGWLDHARAVMLFAPLLRADGSREIQTLPIAQEAWRRGVTVTLPRVNWDARLLTPAVVHDYDHLVTGPHGVMEPAPDLPAFSPNDLDLIVVPGLAFDRRGHRLGHGVGFYDRFLGGSALRADGGSALRADGGSALRADTNVDRRPSQGDCGAHERSDLGSESRPTPVGSESRPTIGSESRPTTIGSESRATRVGLALAAQVVETLPDAPHDVPMDVVVTEEEVFLPSSRHR